MNRRLFLQHAAKGVGGFVLTSLAGIPGLGWLEPKRDYKYATYVQGFGAIFFNHRDEIEAVNRNGVFEQMASRREIPVNTGISRQFFKYETKDETRDATQIVS